MAQETSTPLLELETETETESQDTTAETTSAVVDTGRRIDVSGIAVKAVKTLRREHRVGPPVIKKNKRYIRPEPMHNVETNGKTEKKFIVETKDATVSLADKNHKTVFSKIDSDDKVPNKKANVGHSSNGVNGTKVASSAGVTVEWQLPMVKPEPKEWDDSGDFGAMLDEEAPMKKLDIEVGSRVKGRLIYMSKETAFFALSLKHEGIMPMAELKDKNDQPTVKIGDVISVYVVAIDDAIHLSKKISKLGADLSTLEEAKNNNIPIEGKIVAVNSGGVEVEMAGIKAFCPIGQVDIHFVEDPSTLVGQTLAFLVKQISGNGRNVVLNRRALLEKERKESAKERLANLEVGQQVTGKIVRLADFGAFVDLNGIDGLIPLSELGFGHNTRVDERVSIGDLVTVEVMRIEPDPKREGQMRISLSLKAAMPDPFETYGQYLVAGASLEGKVARLETFGAFIELFDGVDGLIHISELSEQRVRHPSEVLNIGDPVTVRVLDVDMPKRRISLSLRENVQRQAQNGASTSTTKRGDKLDGVVERVERYGIFLKLSNGQTALLPGSESGSPRGADLNKPFPIGTTVPVMVIEVDDRSRIRVSKIAREKAEEQALVQSYSGRKGQQASLGTFADLLKAKVNS